VGGKFGASSIIDDYAISKLPREAFDENACWVYLTTWSYNLFLDFKMEMFGVNAIKILAKKLSTLRRQIIDIEAIVRYVRKTMILEKDAGKACVFHI